MRRAARLPWPSVSNSATRARADLCVAPILDDLRRASAAGVRRIRQWAWATAAADDVDSLFQAQGIALLHLVPEPPARGRTSAAATTAFGHIVAATAVTRLRRGMLRPRPPAWATRICRTLTPMGTAAVCQAYPLDPQQPWLQWLAAVIDGEEFAERQCARPSSADDRTGSPSISVYSVVIFL